MRKTIFIIVLFSFVLACQAQAQASGGSAASNGTSLLATASGNADSVTLTIPSPSPRLDNLEGVVDIVLNSDAACATISAPTGWIPVNSANTNGGNLCSRIYEHVFAASEGADTSYKFSWAVPTTFTARMLSLTNASAVDASSGAGSYGTSWTPPQVGTNYGGDYLLAFYVNSSNSTWTPPAQMSSAQQNSTNGYPDLITQAWQETRGATLSYEAGSDGGGQWGIAQLVAFRPASN